jgi:hypothetical protein
MPQPPTVILPLIDDDMTIDAVFERLRDKKRGGFVLSDPKGSRVVTASTLRLTQQAGNFNGDTRIAALRDRIIPTWTEPEKLWDRWRGFVKVGDISVPRALAEGPQEGYSVLEVDRRNQLATVMANDPRQLEELQTPPD